MSVKSDLEMALVMPKFSNKKTFANKFIEACDRIYTAERKYKEKEFDAKAFMTACNNIYKKEHK